MPVICYIPQFSPGCPVECFMKLLLWITLLILLVFLPLACLCTDRCTRSGRDKQLVCHFCNLPNMIANAVGKICDLLCGLLPGASGTSAPESVPVNIKEKVEEIKKKMNEISKEKPKERPKEKPKDKPKETPKEKQKKKLSEKVSDLFKKCRSKKSKEKVNAPTSCGKPDGKVPKSKSEPKLDQPKSDLALSGSCPKCVDSKIACPDNCPKAER